MIIPEIPGRYLELRGSRPRNQLSANAEVLNAPFAGSNSHDSPSASAFGTLTRIVRLNEIGRTELSGLFGIRVRKKEDLSAVMTFSEARQVALAEALRLPQVPGEWNLSTWLPFDAPSSLLETGWEFRYCPRCLRQGYHTLLHQLPWVNMCPWHDEGLRTDCNKCGNPACVAADWTPGENLRCTCGENLLITDAALGAAPPDGAAEFTSNYLNWAREQRACSSLVIPQLATNPRPALTTLIQLPTKWRRFAEASHVVCVRQSPPTSTRRPTDTSNHCRTFKTSRRAPAPDRDGLVRLEELRRVRPGFLTTPKRLVPMMSAVAGDLALLLPPKSLTDREMTLFLQGTGIEAPKGFDPAGRAFSPQISLLPPSMIGKRQFLNLTCVHPAVYRLVTDLVDTVLDRRTLFDFHAQTSAPAFDLLLRICGQLLARGYAEGLRSTLAAHLPDLYRIPRLVPRLHQPWALVRRSGRETTSVRVVWEPLSYVERGESALLAEADDANRRRQRAGGEARRSARVK